MGQKGLRAAACTFLSWAQPDEEEQSECDSYLSVAGESSFFPPTFLNQMRTYIGEPYLNPGF